MMTRAPFALLAGMAALSIAAAALTSPANASQPELGGDALARVMPGAYLLSERDGAERTICLAEPERVLQVAHVTAGCGRAVLARSANGLTVRYSCPGTGVGQSELIAYTSGRFQLHTQGVSRGAPFDRRFDARRIGACAPSP